VDWRIALRSWPCLLFVAAALMAFHYQAALFQFVKA
jgi:hypothetical protein